MIKMEIEMAIYDYVVTFYMSCHDTEIVNFVPNDLLNTELVYKGRPDYLATHGTAKSTWLLPNYFRDM